MKKTCDTCIYQNQYVKYYSKNTYKHRPADECLVCYFNCYQVNYTPKPINLNNINIKQLETYLKNKKLNIPIKTRTKSTNKDKTLDQWLNFDNNDLTEEILEALNNIDINVIEKYIRNKKLNNL